MTATTGDADGGSLAIRDATCVVAIAAVLFLGRLGATQLWDEDEPRNARCAVEMLERGDYVVPMFNGRLRTHKPVLLYWLMMGAIQIFGPGEFAARLPSAVCGIGTVFGVWLIGRRLFGPKAGFCAAICLSSTLMFSVSARAATPDSVLVLAITAAMAVYVRSTVPASVSEDDSGSPAVWFPQSLRGICAFYAALGVAVLAKGPVGFLLPMAIVGMYLLIVRQPVAAGPLTRSARLRRVLAWFAPAHFLRTLWCMRPVIGTAVVLVVALPWYAAVGVRTNGEWLRGFLLEHNLGRATGVMESHSGPFLLYYIAAAFVGFFPWSLAIRSAVSDVVTKARESGRVPPGVVFALCWILVPIVLFSFAATKLPSYITPGLAGLALLVGSFLSRVESRAASAAAERLRTAFVVGVVVGVLLIAALIVAAGTVFPGEWQIALPAVLLTAGTMGCLFLVRRDRPVAVVRVYAATAVLFVLTLHQFAAIHVSRLQRFPELAVHVRQSNVDCAVFGPMRSGWVYYADRTLEQFDATESVQRFLSGSGERFLLAQSDQLARLPTEVRSQLEQTATVPLFLKPSRRVLLLRRRIPAADSTERHELSAQVVGHRKVRP